MLMRKSSERGRKDRRTRNKSAGGRIEKKVEGERDRCLQIVCSMKKGTLVAGKEIQSDGKERMSRKRKVKRGKLSQGRLVGWTAYFE